MAGCIFGALLHKDTALADRSVTISGSSIFYTTGDAVVWAHQELEDDDNPKEPAFPEYYSMFVFKNGTDAINYRKNLAFSWIYNSSTEVKVDTSNKDEENADEGTQETVEPASITPEKGWFNMEIGFDDSNFDSYNFKKFVITFESQQCVQTKDGKTTNYVLFYPHEGSDGKLDGVQAVIGSDIDEEPKEDAYVLKGHIYIEFTGTTEYEDGYTVKVSDERSTELDETYTTGEFNNVGYTYAKYSSSTTTPVTPLSFKAEFEEEDGKNTSGWTGMVIYKLNGQSFRVGTYRKIDQKEDGTLDVDNFKENYRKYFVRTEDGRGYIRNTDDEPVEGKEYYTYSHGTTAESHTYTKGETTVEGEHRRGGTINDNAPPVICFSNGITHVGVGKELPFDYQLIDVLASSPSADTYYYMLTNTQAEKEDFLADNYADKDLFRLVTDSDNQYMEPHKDHYVPKSNEVVTYDKEDFKVVAAVKVYLKLYDTRTDSINQTTYVLLDWFVKDKNLVKVNGNNYIAVANDEAGVSFAYTQGGESHTDDKNWEALVDAYQELVTEAAKDLKAGSKNYFYLPSFENIVYGEEHGEPLVGSLFADNITAYEDLSFNVYYNNGSNGNTSTQKSNTLSINLTKEGRYFFTIYATDKASNPMYYYKNVDGEYERKTFTASNIWSMRESKKNTEYEDTKDYLPWFYFNVESSEMSIEDPGEREAAYVGTKYTSISFDVNAVSYDRKYELYRFDNDVYYQEKGVALTYGEFMEQKEDLLEKNPEWFTEIPTASSLVEGSDEYDEFYSYGWNSSSLEFVPQDANTFYVVKLTVTSTVNNLEPKTAYMGISCSAQMTSLKGEDTWLQDNMTSVILLSIAGASLIGIILLLVIKPKEKGDIDEQYEAETKKKNKK